MRCRQSDMSGLFYNEDVPSTHIAVAYRHNYCLMSTVRVLGGKRLVSMLLELKVEFT